jgi:hypothetical protein
LTITTSFLNIVEGRLSKKSCEKLAELVLTLPENGVILDLNCGYGRATISMGMALDEAEQVGMSILAVDTHVLDLRSDHPHSSGSLMKFLDNLRTFKVLHRVTPLIMPVYNVPKLLNKKCANLVVARSTEDIEIARYAIRTKGIIALIGIKQVLPDNEYTLNYEDSDLRIYQKGG